MDRQESSDPRGGAKPTGKSSWSKFYDRCFVQKRPFPQPSKETLSNLSDQHSPTSSGHLGEASTSDNRQGDIRRPGDDTPKNSRTPREADHGEASQEKLSIKQLVNNRLKELEETSGQTDRLLSEIQKACDEHRREDTTNQLANKILEVSNAVSTEICERSQTLQSAYKRFEKDGEGLEEIGRYSQEVYKKVQQTIGERFLRLQDDCNELRETKDLLKTLRDFPHVWKQIDEAKADLSKATEENTKIKELSNRIIEKVDNSRNKLHNKIINVSESNIKEFLDNSWRLQGAWDKLKEDVNQLETLRKASREWKEARQIKEEFIGTLSEERKGAAGMRAEMVNKHFEQFISFLEEYTVHENRWKLDKTLFESNYQKLKDIVVGDLKRKWTVLTESRKILFKDYENLSTSSTAVHQSLDPSEHRISQEIPGVNLSNNRYMRETTEKYGQFALSLGEENFAEARKLVGQLAESTLSYKFEAKEENLPRRTQAMDRLRKLLRMTRDHRPGRVNKIAGEFNKTLEEMKGKLAAVPEEVKYKVVEATIAMMKDFKESYDDAVRGYGKRKGRTARGEGERRIKEFNSQLNALNDAISSYKQIQDIQTNSIESLGGSYKEIAKKAVEDANHGFMQMLNREGDWQSLKDKIENACRSLADIVEPKIVSKKDEKVSINKRTKDSTGSIIDETHEISMDIESLIITKKGFIEEIASATTMGKRKNKINNEDSSYISEHGGGVFDGVSQGRRGAEASQMAKEFFKQKLSELSDKIKSGEIQKENINGVLKQITLDTNNKMNNELNNEIHLENNNNERARTTLSAVISIGDGKMAAVNIGDSRVYVLTGDGYLKHITKDDSPLSYDKEDIRAMQQEIYPFANVLSNHIEGDKLSEGEQKEIQEKIAKMSDDDMEEFKTKLKSNYDTMVARYKEINTVDTETSLMNTNKDWDTIVNEELIDKGKLSLEEIKMGLVIRHGSYIGNSLGDVDTEPNIDTFKVNPGDRIIITSDGVHDNLNDQEIIDCVSKCKTAEDAAKALVKTALEKSLDQTRSRRKEGDDTTAVVVECSGEGGNNVQTSDRVTVQPQPGHEAGQGTSNEIVEELDDQN